VFYILLIQGQNVKVVNEFYEPIENVSIINLSNNYKTHTNYKGVANLSKVEISDSLCFIHLGYNNFYTTLNKLMANDFWVFMEEDNYILDHFEFSTLREKKKISSKPNKEIISEEKIIEMNASTSADILTSSSGITLQKSQLGGGSPIIRGFEANRVLLVVDGVRMNNAIYRSGHLQNSISLDNNTLSQIDIFYGASSVVFGSDAIGGVVHYQTKTPSTFNIDTIVFSGKAMLRYNTAASEINSHVDFTFSKKNFGSFTSISVSDFGDLKMGQNRSHGYKDWGYIPFYVAQDSNKNDFMQINEDSSMQVGTGYNQIDLLQKFVFDINNNIKIIFNNQFSTSSDIPRFDRLNDISNSGIANYSEWSYGPQTRILSSVNTTFSKSNKIYDRASAIISFQNLNEERITRPFQNINRSIRKEDVNVFALNIDLIKAIDSSKQIYYGSELTHNIVNSIAYTENIFSNNRENTINTRYPDGGSNLSSIATYASFKWSLNKMILQSGIRYSHSLMNATFIDTSFINMPYSTINNNNGAVSGSINIDYIFSDKTQFNFSIGSGFRSPNIDDFGKIFKKGDFVLVPNNKLNPEYSYQLELGFTQSIFREVNNDEFKIISFSSIAYATLLDNAIIRADYTLPNGKDSILYDGVMCRINTNINSQQAIIYGVSTNIQINFSKTVSLKSGINYTKGELTASKDPFAHIPPIFGKTRLLIENNRWDFEVFSIYNGWKRKDEYSPGNVDNPIEATIDGTPSWITFNFRAGLELHKYINIQFAGYNLLDAHYKQFASGISAPGRSFMISIRTKF
jgi:hemoglobin/transferrin/lactoferrin receptor protein